MHTLKRLGLRALRWLAAGLMALWIVLRFPSLGIAMGALNAPSVGDPVIDLLLDICVGVGLTFAMGFAAELVVLAVAMSLSRWATRGWERWRVHSAMSKAWTDARPVA